MHATPRHINPIIIVVIELSLDYNYPTSCDIFEGEMTIERLNPLLRPASLQAANDAACRLDGMFRDLFNDQERIDLIVTIISAASKQANKEQP
jgi:hypothetical protein